MYCFIGGMKNKENGQHRDQEYHKNYDPVAVKFQGTINVKGDPGVVIQRLENKVFDMEHQQPESCDKHP